MTALNAIRHLDHTVLFARNMPAMRRFYRDVMGFDVNRELGPQWVEFRIGSSLLTLTQRGLMWNDEPPTPGALSVQLAFRVAPAEVGACADALAASGIKLEHPVTDQPWGHRTVFFRDPDGNVLEIYAEL